jgi:hypothetical protein
MVFGTEDLPPRAAVIHLLYASRVAPVIHLLYASRVAPVISTMAALGLADHLADSLRSVDELAEASQTHAPTLARLLRTLAALGLVSTEADGRVGLTPSGQLLWADVPDSLRAYVLGIYAPHSLQAWTALSEAVRTGEAAFPRVHGVGYWDYLAAHPEQQQLFDAAMTGLVGQRAAALLETCDLTDIRTLVDIGGGQGRLLTAALGAYPHLRGILFDRPEVLAGADRLLRTAGVANRCDLVAGNFFVSVPRGGDAYVLAMVVHDWPDAEALALLRSCGDAMEPGARLWLIEQVIRPGDAYDPTKLLDMHMLVLFGAQEGTAEEYQRLLEAAGFHEVTFSATATPFSVVKAVRSQKGRLGNRR